MHAHDLRTILSTYLNTVEEISCSESTLTFLISEINLFNFQYVNLFQNNHRILRQNYVVCIEKCLSFDRYL